MLAFLSENRRAGDLEWRSSQAFAFRIEKLDPLPRDHCDVTVFQVIDHVGKWRKGNRVRAEIHLAQPCRVSISGPMTWHF